MSRAVEAGSPRGLPDCPDCPGRLQAFDVAGGDVFGWVWCTCRCTAGRRGPDTAADRRRCRSRQPERKRTNGAGRCGRSGLRYRSGSDCSASCQRPICSQMVLIDRSWVRQVARAARSVWSKAGRSESPPRVFRRTAGPRDAQVMHADGELRELSCPGQPGRGERHSGPCPGAAPPLAAGQPSWVLAGWDCSRSATCAPGTRRRRGSCPTGRRWVGRPRAGGLKPLGRQCCYWLAGTLTAVPSWARKTETVAVEAGSPPT